MWRSEPFSTKLRMERPKRLLFGVVVGIAIGLLFSSVLVILTTLWYIFFIWPVVLFGLVLGFLTGWKRWLLYVGWWVILLVVIVGWPVCIWGPVGIRTLQFYWIASHEIPVYPRAVKMKTIATPLAADNVPGVQVLLWTEASHEQIIQFYQYELAQRKWKELPPQNMNDDVYYCFEKPGYRINIVMWVTGWGGNNVRVTCDIYNLHYRPKKIYLSEKW